MTFQYKTCKKCKKLGVKVSRIEGYYTYKKGFVGKAVRVYVPPKEQVLDPICKFCGFDNRKEIIKKKEDLLFSIMTERFWNDNNKRTQIW